MAIKGFVEINTEICKGCELCIPACPFDCLELNTHDTNSHGLHYVIFTKEDKCVACLNCSLMCPEAAITVYKKNV